MEKSSKEYYEFKKKLKELKQIRGQGTELISIYLAPGYNVSEMSNRLRDEYGQASNIKSKQTRKNVQAAIERIIHLLKGVNKPPENGIAIFCGNVNGKIELYTIIPPEPVNVTLYRCDSTFFLDPLLELIQPSEVYGLMTIDRKEATIALLKGKRVEIVNHFESYVPGKHRAGGQSSVRFERLIEIAAHEFFKKVGEAANKVFSDPSVKGVIIGGPGPTKNYFLNEDYLNHVVKGKIVGTIDTGYTDEMGIKEMVDRSGEIMEELEATREKKLVDKFMTEVAKGGLATYGEKEVRQALENGQVDTLLLSEDLDWLRVKARCQACGKEYELTVRDKNKIPDRCSDCGGKLEVVEEKLLVEDLAELAEQMGTKVEMISSDTPEGAQFLNAFGGIGALLRFKA